MDEEEKLSIQTPASDEVIRVVADAIEDARTREGVSSGDLARIALTAALPGMKSTLLRQLYESAAGRSSGAPRGLANIEAATWLKAYADEHGISLGGAAA